MFFISSEELFSFTRYINFCLDVSVLQKELLTQKDKVNFKNYDVTNWLTNISNTYIAQYFTKQKQLDNENQSVHRFITREIFFFKNHEENLLGELVPDFFLFFKKTLYVMKASGLQLSFNIFRQPSTSHTVKLNCIKFQTIDPQICSILNFQKRVWEQFNYHILCMIF